MTRPIEQQRQLWITMKEAAAIRGRHFDTVRAWVRLGIVRSWREPGGRVLVFRPDVLPPEDVPPFRRRP